jgi:hypothetical protein
MDLQRHHQQPGRQQRCARWPRHRRRRALAETNVVDADVVLLSAGQVAVVHLDEQARCAQRRRERKTWVPCADRIAFDLHIGLREKTTSVPPSAPAARRERGPDNGRSVALVFIDGPGWRCVVLRLCDAARDGPGHCREQAEMPASP